MRLLFARRVEWPPEIWRYNHGRSSLGIQELMELSPEVWGDNHGGFRFRDPGKHGMWETHGVIREPEVNSSGSRLDLEESTKGKWKNPKRKTEDGGNGYPTNQ